MKNKKNVTYAKRGFVMIKRKNKLNCANKSVIIVITLENEAEQLIVFAICYIYS